MTRSIQKKRIACLVKQELRSLLKLSPWVLVSLFLAAVVWRTDLVATSGLFQSPPTATATPRPPAPTDTPTVTPTVALTPTMEITPTLEATATPTVTATVPLTPTEVPPTPTATEVPPTATLAPSPTTEMATPEATPDDRQRYADENANYLFEWGDLFDSVALGASYIWLCCGVFVLVLIPILFLALWVASRRRQQQIE